MYLNSFPEKCSKIKCIIPQQVILHLVCPIVSPVCQFLRVFISLLWSWNQSSNISLKLRVWTGQLTPFRGFLGCVGLWHHPVAPDPGTGFNLQRGRLETSLGLYEVLKCGAWICTNRVNSLNYGCLRVIIIVLTDWKVRYKILQHF